MASMLDRITVEPDQCGGRPCIRGLRVRVKDILDMLAGARREPKYFATIQIWRMTISPRRSNSPRALRIIRLRRLETCVARIE